MPDWSRRRALHALASSTALALAGCTGESGFETESMPRDGTPVTDYETVQVRSADDTPLFWEGERSTTGENARSQRHYFTSEKELTELTFASGNEAATTLRSFATATDYETESLSLHSTDLPACYDLKLVRVSRESDGYTTSFCRSLKPADADCRADAVDTVGLAIRLPFPGDEFTSYGSRWSRDCEERPYPLTPTNTTAGDSQ